MNELLGVAAVIGIGWFLLNRYNKNALLEFRKLVGTPVQTKFSDQSLTSFPVDCYVGTDSSGRRLGLAIASNDSASFVIYTLEPKSILERGSGSLTAAIVAQI